MRSPEILAFRSPQIQFAASRSTVSASSAWNHDALFQIGVVFMLLGVLSLSLEASVCDHHAALLR